MQLQRPSVLLLVSRTCSVQHDGVILCDGDLLHAAQLRQLNLLQLVAKVLADHLTTYSSALNNK
jgi:hypothetical protein